MAGFQIETGTAHGRGFSGTDANGICAKFYTWITKAYAAGGPLWYIHDDFSACVPHNFATTDVNTTSEEITVTGHGYSNDQLVVITSTGTVPGNLTAGTQYYVVRVNDNTIKLASSITNSRNKTAINISSQGTGTHTITPYEFFVVVTDTSSPVLNDYNTGPGGNAPKFVKLGYQVSEAGYIRSAAYLWWDNTTHQGEARFGADKIATYDDADYAYYFSGGAEQINIFSRLGTAWTYFRLDDFVGDTNFLEATTKVGVLQSGITAGSSVVLQLDSGQALNFTEDKYYFIYDFDGHTWVNYVKVTDVDTGTDQITVDSLTVNFPTGTVISSYAHRYYTHVSQSCAAGEISLSWNARFNIPYYSAAAGYVVDTLASTVEITGGISLSYMSTILSICSPDDLGYYACQKPSITELYRANTYTVTITGMNRCYGVAKNTYATGIGTMAQMLDYRTINATDWLFFGSSSAVPYLMLITESES